MSREKRKLSSDPIPSRWLKCPPKSYEFLINKFVVFKTPLSCLYDSQVKDDIFRVDLVFQSMKNKRAKLGLWIDLTNTSRYYDKEEVEKNECQYVKLQCEGHGGAPSVPQTDSFIKLCDRFIRQRPLEMIGVHCTHGFNRSGFLVVSYLVQIMDWELGAAIAEFARIRPPGIYKQDYLIELYRRYDEVEYAPAAPPLPDWCFEDEEEAEEDCDDFTPQRKKKKREAPQFMEGVSGVEPVPEHIAVKIQKEVKDFCKWRKSGFPGSQPVSLSIQNLHYLSDMPYRVSWKADGVRYLLYIKGKHEVYCIDRNNDVFLVKNLTFPFRKNLHAHISNTLLDGELVIDKVNGKSIPRYLAYDVISFVGEDVTEQFFHPQRYKIIEIDIIRPREEAVMKGLLNKAQESFSVRLKEFFDVTFAEKLLSETFKRKLSHEPDGLIFQPARKPYVAGKSIEVLKWKPLSLNSVDFRLKITYESGEGIVKKKVGDLYVANKTERYGRLASLKHVKDLDSKIIECTYDNGKWVFMRERTDKSFPNSFETAEKIYLPSSKGNWAGDAGSGLFQLRQYTVHQKKNTLKKTIRNG